MATIIRANGTVQNVPCEKYGGIEWTFLKSVVGGYLEAVRIRDGLIMWINEEGKLNNLPYNRKATDLFNEPQLNYAYQRIAGDVIICSEWETGDSRRKGDIGILDCTEAEDIPPTTEYGPDETGWTVTSFNSMDDFFAAVFGITPESE